MLLIQAFAQSLAADGAALFILKDDDLKRMAERDLLFFERLSNFNGRERAHVAVIVPAHGNRVNVRADQQGLERWIAARAAADDVSRSVDMNVQAGRFHQTDGIFPSLEIGLRVGNAADAALRVGAELRELFQMV